MIYDKSYYIDSEISNYKNYTDKHFDALAREIIKACGLKRGHMVLDFGCALGGLVQAINNRGVLCLGTDISYWAVNKGRGFYGLNKNILQHYSRSLLESPANDLVIFLDVLEHIDADEIQEMLKLLRCDRVFVRIPISAEEGKPYLLDCSNADKSHKAAHSRQWWHELFGTAGYWDFTPVVKQTIYDSDGVLVGIYERRR